MVNLAGQQCQLHDDGDIYFLRMIHYGAIVQQSQRTKYK